LSGLLNIVTRYCYKRWIDSYCKLHLCGGIRQRYECKTYIIKML